MSNELTTTSSDSLALMMGNLDGMIRAAGALRKSGLIPAAVKSDEAALAIILAGRELGMQPMEAFRSFHVINGKPTMDASAQLARAIRAGVAVEWPEQTDKVATCVLTRGAKTHKSTFTIAQAERAGLTRNPTWKSFPEAMLRARAITAGIRAFCPDVVGGPMYSPDEAADPEPVVVDQRRPALTVDPTPPTWTDDERASWEESIAKFPEHVTAVVIDDWQQSKDKPLPSAMTPETRAQFLAYLQSAKGLDTITAYTKSLESK
jgi:hypothetical protein